MPLRRGSLARSVPFALGVCLLLTACDHYAAAKGTDTPQLTPTPSPATVTARDTCAAPPASSPIAVGLVRRVDGTCAPLDQAFLFRCDPSMPAVAVIDDGNGVRRFLGGVYAVPVPEVPPTGFPMGVTGFGAVFQDPADPALLWVEADGRVERWLALPNRNKVADPTTAQMIGDSILDGGQTDVVADLPTWTIAIDALVGRGSDGAAGVAESLPDPAADAVVIEIGVNDADPAATAVNAQRIIAAQSETRVLVWLTAHGPEIDVPAINGAIVSAMGSIPNGTVLDWNRLVPLDALSSDGVHPDTGRQDVLASIMAPFLRTWRDAVTGAGPTACEQTIRAAA